MASGEFDPSTGRVAAILIARMDSSRLPGKVLRPVGGVTVLDVALSRLRLVAGIDEIVLATTAREIDAPLVTWGQEHGLAIHLGALNDVAGRFVAAARSADAEWALRANGDSPFPDPDLIESALAVQRDGLDLVSNLAPRTHPYGISVELVRVQVLADLLDSSGVADEDREHVTRVVYRLAQPHRVGAVPGEPGPQPDVRLVVDTAQDLQRFERVVDRLGDRLTVAGWLEVVAAYVSLEDAQ